MHLDWAEPPPGGVLQVGSRASAARTAARDERTRMMQNASRSLAASAAYAAIVAAPMLHLERHFGIRRLKRGMLAMLAAWIGYFVIISLWARALNKVMVPVLDMPLGIFLVAQGTVIVFFASLFMLLRTASR
jgi:uncharacterized membrane protein